MRGRQYIFKEIVKYDTFIGSSQQVRFIVRIKTMGSARLQSAVLPLRPGRVRFRCADEHSRRSHHKGRLEGGPVYSAGASCSKLVSMKLRTIKPTALLMTLSCWRSKF